MKNVRVQFFEDFSRTKLKEEKTMALVEYLNLDTEVLARTIVEAVKPPDEENKDE